MRVEPTVFDGPEAVGRALAALVADRIEEAGAGRSFLLGCPSGRSPRTTYAALAREVATRHLDLTGLVIVMMDEYVERDGGTGQVRRIDAAAPHSCVRFGQTEIVDRLNEKEAAGAFIPGIHVDAVVHTRFGAHPGGCAGLYAPDTVVSTLAGVAVVKIRVTPHEGWGRIIKRGFDIVGAVFGLLLIAPLLLLIAAAIAVVDPGPVLFRQERLARAGETFKILKFRTMRVGYSGRPALEVFRELGRQDLVEEFQREQKVKDDPRVSTLGAFLRRTSLDELPQLWNVLRGDLSLVGPRPIVRDELVKFGDFTGTILAIKPGITGLWQTSGRNDISYEERVELNIQYVENWSLRLDILILLRTLALVLRGGGGAY